MVGVTCRVCSSQQFSDKRATTNSKNLERCKPDKGRISLFKRKVSSKKVDNRRAALAHQLTGASSSKGESLSCRARRLHSTSSGQQNLPELHQEAGWHKKYSPLRRGMSAVERSYFQKPQSSDSSLVVNLPERSSGFLEQKQPSSVGVSVITRNFHVGVKPFRDLPHTGCLCEQKDSSAAKIHVMVPGQSGSSSGCIDTSLGSNILSFSTSATDPQIPAKDHVRETDCGNDCSSLANSTLVVPDSGTNGGSDVPSTQLPIHFDNGKQRGLALSQSFGGCSPASIEPNLSKDNDLNSFLSNHLADGTKSGYRSSFNKFSNFCQTISECSKTCGPEIVAQYLKYLYEEGCSYSTVNFARSAISKYHSGYNGISVGSHKLITIACKAIFRLRPPLPKYKTTYDITVVLEHIKALKCNSELSLKLLSYKALFLLTMCTISRMSSVARLGPDLLVYKVGYFLFRIFHRTN